MITLAHYLQVTPLHMAALSGNPEIIELLYKTLGKDRFVNLCLVSAASSERIMGNEVKNLI